MKERNKDNKPFWVTFINLPSHKIEVITICPPIGILSMSACLKKEGSQVKFIDADVCRYSINKLINILGKNPPDLIGIPMNVGHVAAAAKYIRAIKEKFPKTPIVIGGPYVTVMQDQILNEFPAVDFAIAYEGEFAIIDLIDFLKGTKKIEEARNLIYRAGNKIKKNRCERITDLDALPLPDYSLIKNLINKYKGAYPSIAKPSIAIMCTRGCPFNCGFCSSPKLWARKVTFRSIDSVISEIKLLRQVLGIKEIFLQDDTLNARPDWFMELCDKIIENNLNKQIYFKCEFRVNKGILTEELLRKAKQANFWMIFYGVEHGNQDMLNRMNKGITIEEIERAFKLTRDCGICSYAPFIVGYPGETKKTFADSLALLKKIKPDFSWFASAIPFPGTELYRIASEQGLIPAVDFKKYQYGDVIIRTHELETQDILLTTETGINAIQKITSSSEFKRLAKTSGCDRYHKMLDGPFYCEKRRLNWWLKQFRKWLRAMPLLAAIKNKIRGHHELY